VSLALPGISAAGRHKAIVYRYPPDILSVFFLLNGFNNFQYVSLGKCDGSVRTTPPWL